ncbi:hypothetical protein [Asticcacaulis sp. YBE204]|uniref:hypothetical protein n=1 Tax=Asticcacaulis sp. YBE204 TaxID=1282363 RepID=UPI0003C3F136|nr:hypothetical protein [Asticcacaulis sp. YBE204]ESQ78315.1 hypothetical protein AEYBE204_14180 [Asticcacaulis sp. YBE204]
MNAQPITENRGRDLRSLRYVEHFLTWALRTSVACSPHCRMLQREFVHAFGPEPSAGVRAFHDWLIALSKGKRKLELGRPGLIELTRDEESLLALLTSAQMGEAVRFTAQARWVMGSEPHDGLYDAARMLMTLLDQRGYRMVPKALPNVSAECRGRPGELRAV